MCMAGAPLQLVDILQHCGDGLLCSFPAAGLEAAVVCGDVVVAVLGLEGSGLCPFLQVRSRVGRQAGNRK